jgi:hypothetical protein
MAWANSSLPVPDSPMITTGKFVAAAFMACHFRADMALLPPTMLSMV